MGSPTLKAWRKQTSQIRQVKKVVSIYSTGTGRACPGKLLFYPDLIGLKQSGAEHMC